MTAVNVPDVLRRNVIGVWGARGEQWLRDLAQLVDDVAREWRLELEQPFPMTFHWVHEVRRDDGTPAVLKLAVPGSDHQAVETAALMAWSGRGAVELLAQDAEASAHLSATHPPQSSSSRTSTPSRPRGLSRSRRSTCW